jgi:hypothetical protein
VESKKKYPVIGDVAKRLYLERYREDSKEAAHAISVDETVYFTYIMGLPFNITIILLGISPRMLLRLLDLYHGSTF